MRRMLLVVLQLVHRILQLVVPARSRQVAWASSPPYIGNAFHLYRHMLASRQGIDHVWLVVGDDVELRIRADLARWGDTVAGNTVRVAQRHSVRGYWAYLRSRYVFHTHGVYRWVSSAVRRECVSLWHGMPIKAIGALNTITPNPHPTYGTLHLATSPAYRPIIAAAFRATEDDVLLTSLPRCDVLDEPSSLAPPDSAIRAAAGVDGDQRLVLWMPTYRTPAHRRDARPGVAGFRTFLDDLTSEQWERIDHHAALANARVVVKLHPDDALNDIDHDPCEALGLQQVHLVRAYDWLDRGIELYDLLAATDGLISDVSSVVVDWLLTDRPLGQVGFDPATYTRDVVIDVERFMASPRIHDLADPAMVDDFFDRIGHGRDAINDPDLNAWLYPRDMGSGCETVLRAVGF